jgi:hypothetical protein
MTRAATCATSPQPLQNGRALSRRQQQAQPAQPLPIDTGCEVAALARSHTLCSRHSSATPWWASLAGRSVAANRHLHEGIRGPNSPRYPNMRVDIQRHTIARTIASAAASPVDSFAALALHLTAGSMSTHQRTPQRAAVPSYPRRFPAMSGSTALCANVVQCQRLTSLRTAISLCHCHIEKVLARVSNHAFHSVEAVEGARWPNQALAGEILQKPNPKDRRQGGWQGTWRACRTITFLFWRAAAPRKSGRLTSQIIGQHCGALLTR